MSFAAVYVGNAPDGPANPPYTVLSDRGGNLSAMYNVKRVPRLFLIHNGKIALVQNGYYEENAGILAHNLRKILASKKDKRRDLASSSSS